MKDMAFPVKIEIFGNGRLIAERTTDESAHLEISSIPMKSGTGELGTAHLYRALLASGNEEISEVSRIGNSYVKFGSCIVNSMDVVVRMRRLANE